jgi:hypothetical protein
VRNVRRRAPRSAIADNHAHLVTFSERIQAGRFAQVVEAALRRRLRLAVPFAPAYFKPVHDQSHLRSLVPYVHRQAAHHQVVVDPFAVATSLPICWAPDASAEPISPIVSRSSLHGYAEKGSCLQRYAIPTHRPRPSNKPFVPRRLRSVG